MGVCIHILLGEDLGDKSREGTRGAWKGIPWGVPFQFFLLCCPEVRLWEPLMNKLWRNAVKN